MQFYGMVGAEGRIYASVDQPQLVQIMSCRWVGAKPFSEPIMEHCSLDLQISVFIMRLKMSSAKWRILYFGLNVSTYWGIVTYVQVGDTEHTSGNGWSSVWHKTKFFNQCWREDKNKSVIWSIFSKSAEIDISPKHFHFMPNWWKLTSWL